VFAFTPTSSRSPAQERSVPATEFAATLATAVVVFISTNIDDIVLLAVLFADPKLRGIAVVAGQFIGMGLLVLISAAAGVAAIAVPPGWTSVLGVIPLAIGFFMAIRLLRSRVQGNELDSDVVTVERRAGGRSQVLAVAGITLANGGDNLSVYVPIFAADRSAILTYTCVFAALTAVWCFLGYRLVSNRIVGQKLRRYGHRVLPVVLIALGLHILYGARALLR